jgi:signal transduction histidine kinase/CheY-like chemotaxis protein|tara:strand:+ start:1492 stop:3816 length:2325 start_codon:yes stop_codon:yes gene_type:complete
MSQVQGEDATSNLTQHNFEENPVIYIDDNWEFYWDQLIMPGNFSTFEDDKAIVNFPYLWSNNGYPSFGAATYRVKLILPKVTPDLSLIIPDAYSSYRLFINGVLFAEDGVPALKKESYSPSWSHTLKSLNQLPDSLQGNDLELVLHIANFDHSKGGSSQNILLGTTEALNNRKLKDQAYSWTLTGALILAGLFFLSLFLFSSNDKSILYFALFCLFYTYRVVGFGVYPLHDLIPNIPWIVTIRLEYLTLFISVFFFGLYTYHLYPKEASKLLVNILSGICLLFAITCIFFPPHIFSLTILPFFIILCIYIAYAFYIYVLGMLNKRPGSAFALASTGVVFSIFLYQILNYFGYIDRFQVFNYSGHLLFIFLQSQILSYRFTNSLKEARINAEAASLAKSDFLSTMSHEIRTPLNAVIGFSDLLDDGTLDAKKEEYVRTIRLNGENLLGIVNNILDYSKIESGKLDIEYSEVSPKKLIKMVFEVLSPLVSNREIDLISDLDDNLPSTIKTDKIRLQQVLINLINNAVKFTDQGSVTVSAGINTDNSLSGNIWFTVQDTGIGINEQDIEKLFKRFSQVDSGITRRYGGTGLGLVISKEIVEALGGDIKVKSKKGTGTTFTFTIQADLIPGNKDFTTVEERADLNQKIDPLLKEKFQHLNVLLVEDNVFNQRVTLRILELLGIEADLAENGQEATVKSNTTPYDIIFMDMQMPVMDGLEATRQIRENEESSSSKSTIIALTANATTEDRDKCFEAGMNDFLSKPITIDSTFQLIKKWV